VELLRLRHGHTALNKKVTGIPDYAENARLLSAGLKGRIRIGFPGRTSWPLTMAPPLHPHNHLKKYKKRADFMNKAATGTEGSLGGLIFRFCEKWQDILSKS